MALAAGDRLGPYEILAPLGAGARGEVYRALDTLRQCDVAIEISGIERSRLDELLDAAGAPTRAR